MRCGKMHVFVVFAVVPLLGLFCGCNAAKQAAKAALDPRAKGPMHERLKWKAEDFFTNLGVLALCKAIEAKDIKEIDRLVKSGVDVNAKGRGNMTPLLWAFPMGEDVFKKMLELGADPNVKLTENFLTLRGRSVMFASVELVDGLIYSQFFYDISMKNYLKVVLEHGGNPNAQDLDGQTPVFAALNYSPHAADKIAQLLKFGADINHREERGYTPAYTAASSGIYYSALRTIAGWGGLSDSRKNGVGSHTQA